MAAALPSFESATQGAKSSEALNFLRRSPTKLLIDGKWVSPKSGKTFETINPANEEVLALVTEGDKAEWISTHKEDLLLEEIEKRAATANQ